MGFLHRVADDIRVLKDLLKRYDFGHDGRAVYKELLQNADDAGASRLLVHLMDQGFADGEVANPLLKGPALVVINDGAFRPIDAKNMRYATGTSKSLEVGTVGRFGLGQKSVFHLCEAWFCIGSSEVSGVVHCNIDPWAHSEDGDMDFPEWPTFSRADQDAICTRLANYLHGQNWFILWLPLRQQSHRRKRSGVISDWFPEIDQLAEHLLDLAPLGKLLPQMGNLRRLEVLRHRTPGDVVLESHVELTKEASTLSRPAGSMEVDQWFRGVLITETDGDIRYTGRERVQFVPSLLELQAHPQWPKTLVDDGEGITTTDERIAPHGAVTVIVAPAKGTGRLDVDWCVFLPLMENVWSRPFGTGCRKHVTIRLHGYFFPDHGRRQITGLDQASPAALHQPKDFEAAWNVRLRDSVVLPCLISVVHEALTDLDGAEQVAFIEALYNSPVYRSHAAKVCEHQSLVRGLRADSPFLLVSSVGCLLPIPQSRAISETNLLRPHLERAEQSDATLVLKAGPHLVPPHATFGWSRKHLNAALASPLEDDLINPDILDAVADLLTQVDDWDLRDEAAADLLRRALRRHGSGVFTKKRLLEGWKHLVARLHKTGVLRTRVPIVLDNISDLDLKILILPSDLADRDTASIPIEDGRRVLQRLSPIVIGRTELAEVASRLVAEVVGAMGAQAVLADPALRVLPVFRVWSARAGSHHNISATKLLELRGLGLAFANRGFVRPEQAAKALLGAIKGQEIDVVLAEETLADPLQLAGLSEYDLAKLLVQLRGFSIASQPSARVALLSQLLTSRTQRRLASPGTDESSAITKAAIRFLLHGREEKREDDDQLWKAGQTQDLNHEAVKLVLDAQGSAWRLISEELTCNLSDQWMQLIGVHTLGRYEVLQALGGLEPQILSALGQQASKTAQIFLLQITTKHPEIWKRLPFHDTTDGRQVMLIRGRSYRATSDWSFPPRLGSAVDLIQESSDPTIYGAQTSHIDPWTPHAQIAAILSQPQPSSWALECLDALAALDSGQWLREQLASVPWLPLSDADASGVAIAPKSVFQISNEVAEHLASVLAGREVFMTPSNLSLAVRNHSMFESVLKEFALQGEDLILALTRKLSETSAPDLWIGKGADELPFNDVVASQGLACHAGWQLVCMLNQELRLPELLTRELVPALAQSISLGALLQILNSLADQAEKSLSDQREIERRIFTHYFDLAAHRADFPEVLRYIRVLNRTGQWVSAGQVARVGDNLAGVFRLDEDLQRVADEALERVAPLSAPAHVKHESAESQVDPRASAASLSSYFDPWLRRGVRPEAIGLLVTLFGQGDGGAIWSRADEWLTPTTAASTWDWIFYNATTPLPTALDNDRDTLARARYTIERGRRDKKVVRTISLAGTPFDAELAAGQTLDTIFANLGSVGIGSMQHQHLCLLTVDEHQSLKDLNKLLLQSISVFMTQRLRRRLVPEKFQHRWSQLSESGQVQLSVARQQILDNLATRLEVLQYKRHPQLAGVVAKLRRARQAVAEAEATFEGSGWVEKRAAAERAASETQRRRPALIKQLNQMQTDVTNRMYPSALKIKQEVQALQEAADIEAAFAESGWAEKLDAPKQAAIAAEKELVHLVEFNKDVQQFLLNQVRRKLEEYQYGVGRVLWELAQNADDAAVQLQEMLAATRSDSPAARRLCIEVTKNRVRVTHWGRQINQHTLADFRDGRNRGWDLDLLNMMVLNTSDKSSEHGTTGRFGLGFKSVYLVSDCPRVGSGQLSFEVVAGILPNYIEKTPIRKNEWIENEPPTVFELDLRASELHAQLLADLLAFGGLFAVFSKVIRELRLIQGSAPQVMARWNPFLVPGIEGLEVGEIPIALSESKQNRLIVMRDRSVAVTLLISNGQIHQPPENTPSLWCTAPTKEVWSLGMMINGPMAVDMGRSRVALDRSETREVFITAGRLLVRILGKLANAMEADWETTARILGLQRTRSQNAILAFWRSVWDTLSSGRSAIDPARGPLLRELHGGSRGLHGLVQRHAILPSLLPGCFDCLTSLKKIQYVAERELEEGCVLEVVAGWKWVDGSFRPGTVVSKAVFDVLQVFEENIRNPPGIDLTELLRRWGNPGGRDVDRARAVEFHPIVGWLDMPFMTHSSRDGLRDWMASLRFPSQGHHEAPSRALLIPPLEDPVANEMRRRGDSDRLRKLEDEFLRARFAPPESLLSRDVAGDADAVQFFLACRRLEAGGQADLEQWAQEANTDARREAVLCYCIRGELRHHLCSRFRISPLRWFPDRTTLNGSSLISHWSVEDRVDLQNALFPRRELDQPTVIQPLVMASDTMIDRFFKQLQHWWESAEHRREILEKYEKKVWPAWLRPGLVHKIQNNSDDHWLALLVLGVARSVGWTKDAHHRKFLETARERGWWATFVQPDNDDNWMEMLRTWQDESVRKLEYSRWMALFPSIYQLSRHLNVYRRLLRALDQRPNNLYNFQVLLAPRADENLSGAGVQFDAPPAPLNMGLHFVLRELVRFKVIAPNEHIIRDCWIPSSSLVLFLKRLGLYIEEGYSNSEKARTIHKFMCDRMGSDAANLHLAFDIPLLKVASTKELQQTLGLEE